MPSGLQAAIRGHVFHRGDPGFEGAAHVFNPRFDNVLPTAYGGAINQIAPTATAFVHRRPLFSVRYCGDGATSAWIGQAHTKMPPFVSGRAYQNYIDPTLQNCEHAYYDQNLPRLKGTRQRVDPNHYKLPQAIGR